jgi:hypothetical protein
MYKIIGSISGNILGTYISEKEARACYDVFQMTGFVVKLVNEDIQVIK